MADEEEDEGRVPGPVILFAVGLVAIVLGLGLALMECRAGPPRVEDGDPSGGSVIQRGG